MIDIDDEMTLKEIEEYLQGCFHEYASLLSNTYMQIRKNDAAVTLRKLKRMKKSVVFKMMKMQEGSRR